MTTAKAATILGLGSLLLLVIASIIIALNLPGGWTFFGVGMAGWLAFAVMIVIDVRRRVRVADISSE